MPGRYFLQLAEFGWSPRPKLKLQCVLRHSELTGISAMMPSEYRWEYLCGLGPLG
jgi:hypothetical protein